MGDQLHDMHGIPILVGDLVRCKHYRHRSRRRQLWLYFRVAVVDGWIVLQNWHDLDPDKYQCALLPADATQMEVIDHVGLERNAKGDVITFNERKRKKGGDA